MPLRIEENEYPSGGSYGVFFIGADEIGRADKMPDGWRIFHKRKIMKTAEAAARVMIDDALHRVRAEQARIEKRKEALAMYCGGALPPLDQDRAR